MNAESAFQFYPTGKALAARAFAKFQRPVLRLLEPSAGHGDLLQPTGDVDTRDRWSYSRRIVACDKIDCIEINLAHHPLLKSHGFRVVGHDFLKYDGATIYSHVLMNPPFAEGAEHVLHAWELLYSGELVAIINAETLRNACTKKRELLREIVARHSASPPEFLTEAFMEPDTQRKTAVEIALIHLGKVGDFKADFLDGLARDTAPAASAAELGARSEVLVPERWVQNQVIALRHATTALRESAIADVRSGYYAAMLGNSLTDYDKPNDPAARAASAAEIINDGYAKLKECAWTSVLRSADVTRRLSSVAQKRVEAEFATICHLEFTVENVYAFLGGLIAKQGDIQLEMLCDIFDTFTRYHHENRIYYQGWKSNSRHRTCGMALRASRIVLPACRRDAYDYAQSLSWDDAQMFSDFDKVFALLDGGKPHEATFGLVKLFNDQWQHLRNGGRAQSDYFDARFYPKAGTFHIFPRDKRLVDRLNRLVGKQRAWLPPDDSAPVAKGFWEQFQEAERINRAAATDLTSSRNESWRWYDDDRKQKLDHAVGEALQKACATLGIEYDPDRLLRHGTDRPQLLLT
jgi:hypothetical protein